MTLQRNVIRTALVLSVWILAAGPVSAKPKRLVADLSQDNVEITSTYSGAELLLFGAFEGDHGDDVVVLVSGPQTRLAQRRSDKVAGIWVNVETNIWENAPSFYHVFATRPLADIATPDTLRAAEIGLRSLPLKVSFQGRTQNGHDEDSQLPLISSNETILSSAMIDSLVRNMQDLGLWAEKMDDVKVQQNMLFRVMLDLPKNVPPGNYNVRVVHLRDGSILSEETTRMSVTKAGLSALIYNFAHSHSAFYGLFAIVFAMLSGWLAAAVFRRK